MTRQAEGPNHELFVRVLAQIEREPQTWDQTMWATRHPCGTSYCFAGFACVLSGDEFQFEEQPWRDDDRSTSASLQGGRDVVFEACRFLGIPLPGVDEESEDLFHAANTLDDLYRISAGVLGLDEQVLRDKVAAEVSS